MESAILCHDASRQELQNATISLEHIQQFQCEQRMKTDPGDKESADRIRGQLDDVEQRDVHNAVGLRASTRPVLVAFYLLVTHIQNIICKSYSQKSLTCIIWTGANNLLPTLLLLSAEKTRLHLLSVCYRTARKTCNLWLDLLQICCRFGVKFAALFYKTPQ